MSKKLSSPAHSGRDLRRTLLSILLAAFFFFGCRSGASPTPTSPPASPTTAVLNTTPTPSPTSYPNAEDLTGRVLAALVALDETDIRFKSERSTSVDQEFKIGDQTQASKDRELTTSTGSRIHTPEGLNLILNRRVESPGTQNPTLKGEARSIDGKVYVNVAYENPMPGYARLPEGWLEISGPASPFFWPGIKAFTDFDLGPGMEGDISWLLSNRSLEQLQKTFEKSVVEATVKQDQDKDGSPVEVITLSLKPDALPDTFIGIEPDDPAIPVMVKAVQGAPITHRFSLDQDGRLLSWDQLVRVDLKDLDLSSVPGLPPDTHLKLKATQRLSHTFSDPEAGIEPAEAPAEDELAPSAAFSGEGSPRFHTLAEIDAALNTAVAMDEIEPFWKQITAMKQMPLIFGDKAVFFYRGLESQMGWDGDWSFNLPSNTHHFPGTDLWMHAVDLPPDARLEYQLHFEDERLEVDLLNPLQEEGGLGTKSVVVMPEYTFPAFIEPQQDIPQGELTNNLTISRKSLGYDINYRVYTPAGYEGLEKLPVLYVADGQDYLGFGELKTALDNLIAAGKVRPLVAVFIDPRDTKSGENLREEQFLDNPKYGAFIAEELAPAIDQAYRTDPTPDARGYLGASYGGYFGASFALEHSDQFHLFALQSPAIGHNPEILDKFQAADRLPIKVFMSVGVFRDTTEDTRKLRDIMDEKGYALEYLETNEGHSYGNWRGQFEKMLVYLFGVE